MNQKKSLNQGFMWATAVIALHLPIAHAGHGKLLETAGVTQVEGSGGGGLVPWAVLAGYDTRDEVSVQTYITKLSLDDYRLQSYGASMGIYDRVEISFAQQVFDLRGLPAGQQDIRQNVVGVKYRVLGDFIYTDYPQVSLGIQHKTLDDELIANAVGADETNNGTDIYVAVSRAHLGLAWGYNAFWNFTLRATKANQFGLLGYGGDRNDDYEIMGEVSAGLLLNRQIAIGVEYRQKPDNLSAVEEEDAYDIFLAYFPSKSVNLTAAWVDLGDIAGAPEQEGLYVSLTGYLW